MQRPKPASPGELEHTARPSEGTRESGHPSGLLAGFPEGFIALDEEWRFTYLNPVAVQFLSRYASQPESLLGQSLWKVSPHVAGTPTEAALRRAAVERVDVRLEHYSAPLAAWFELCAFPAGSGVALYFRDISDERRNRFAREQRERLVALRAEVSAALASSAATPTALHRCVEALVLHVDAAFARIWSLSEAEPVLELQASAGCYMHLDGPHSRIPLGHLKIGRIAAERRPHLSNSLSGDPEISDPEWAAREGMTAFAGFPLVVEEHVVGVLALFARQPLSEGLQAELSSVADAVAQFIHRRRAEEALRRSERQYRTLFNSLEEGFCVIQVLFDGNGQPDDFRFLEVNRAFARQTGLRDASGKRMRELVPEHEARWFELYGRVALTGEPLRFEQEARSLDQRWYEVYAFRFGEPELRRVAVLFNDVTARRRAEQEARHAGEQARTILESISDAFFALDREWRFTYVNGEAERLLDRPRHELLGRVIWEEYAPALGTEFERAYRQTMGQNETVTFDAFYPPHARWYEINAYPSPEGISVYFRDANERHRAEQAIRISEERFRAAVGAVSSLLWTNNAQGQMLGEQPGWSGFTGQSYDEYQGYGWAEAVHPEDAQPTIDAWRAAVAERRTFEFEHRVRRRDGVWRLFSIRAVPVLDAEGAIREWVGVHTDITDQREAECRQAFLVQLSDALGQLAEPGQVMLTASELLGRHLQVNRVGYGEIDPEGHFSNVLHDWVDGSVPHITGQHRLADFGDWVLSQYRAGCPVRLVDAETDPRSAGVSPAYRKLGGVRAALGIPLVKEGRWIATLFIHHSEPRIWTDEEEALAREVADRTWAAVERARAEEEVRKSRARFGAALSIAHLGTFDWNVRTGAVILDERSREIFGFAPGEGNQADEVFSRIHAEDVERVAGEVAEASRSGLRLETEYRIQHPNGEIRTIASINDAVQSTAGGAERMLGVFDDITERKRAETELREADRRKDEFLATLAHELRNPLGAISNALSVLRETGNPDPARIRLRNVLDRQTRHLRRLVDDLLDVSRINRGKFELKCEVLELQPLIANVVEILEPSACERGHQVEVSQPAEPVRVAADTTRLEQVLWNLLHNAVKYTPPGGRIWVDLQVEEASAAALIRIRDNGIGIPTDLLPRIFDVFAQADQALDRSEGGLGLGLTLVKQLVEMHGGEVEARSKGPGQGAEFCIRLPLIASEAAPPALAEPAGSLETAHLRVLVVDDLVDAAETLSELLEWWGHEVRLAHNGPDALAKLQADPVDVVLLDIGLPGMNGYEVAARVRQFPPERQPYLVALTGYGQPEDRRRSAEAGIDQHLLKPVHPDELQTLLASLNRRESS